MNILLHKYMWLCLICIYMYDDSSKKDWSQIFSIHIRGLAIYIENLLHKVNIDHLKCIKPKFKF